MRETKFSVKRGLHIASMVAAMLVYSVYLACLHRFLLDKLLILLFLNAVFLPFLVLVVELDRMEGRVNRNSNSDLSLLSLVFAGCVVLYMGFVFLPAYMAPVMIPALFLTAAGNERIGMVAVTYLNTLLCMVSNASYYEYASYTLLTVCGCMLSLLYARKKLRIYGCVILLALSIVIPCMFYYISCYEMNYWLYLFALANGIVTVLLMLFCFDKLYHYAKEDKKRSLSEIIAEDFPLVQEVKRYSEIDYAHAVKVSRVARACARHVGANEMVAAAAGFYYRIGKLEGEPFVENGVSLAEINCFPQEVIDILQEYNGEQKAISTLESAIVHMVDLLVTKFELLDQDTLRSEWNHDIVIYQTLNEKSSEGIYDASGMGMNQFLNIRTYLAKGVDLF